MNDPVAAADQAVETIKGVARVHCAYYLQCLDMGMHHDDALIVMQTMMWVLNSRVEDKEDD